MKKLNRNTITAAAPYKPNEPLTPRRRPRTTALSEPAANSAITSASLATAIIEGEELRWQLDSKLIGIELKTVKQLSIPQKCFKTMKVQ